MQSTKTRDITGREIFEDDRVEDVRTGVIYQVKFRMNLPYLWQDKTGWGVLDSGRGLRIIS